MMKLWSLEDQCPSRICNITKSERALAWPVTMFWIWTRTLFKNGFFCLRWLVVSWLLGWGEKASLELCICYWSECFCPPPDGETDVAFYLSVRGQTVQRDDRAGGERRQPSPQLLLLHQDRHGAKGNESEAAEDLCNDYILSAAFFPMLSPW